MSKQDRKYVKNYGGVIWREKRKGKKNKLEQALNTRTGKLIYPLQKQQVSESLSRGDRKGKREKVREKEKEALVACLLLMGLFLAFTCSTYKQTGVTTYLCALHMLDSPSSELGLITASTF